jgi:predicted transcriptional regulator of viral defense system
MAKTVFTLSQARAAGLSKAQVYAQLRAGALERAGRGVYVRAGALDPAWEALAAATAMRPEATMCLTSALVHHELSDAIPFAADIALPRGVRHPAGFEHVAWHSFDPATFAIGRQELSVGDGIMVAMYSPERTIIDCFRLAYREGHDQANAALRRWLTRRGSQPSTLLDMAAAFPKARTRLRHALEVLL